MRLTDLDLTEAEAAELGDLLRGRIPEVAAEAVQEIETQLPVLVRPHDPRYAEFLGQSVHWGIGRFVELIAGGDAQLEGLCEFYRDLGVLIAEEGIPQDAWQASFRVSAGVAINRLTESVGTFPGVTPTAIAKVAQAVLDYLEQITGAMAEGYASAREISDVLQNRRKLLDLLITDDPHPDEIRQLALAAGWRVPGTIAAVALRPRDHKSTDRPTTPAEALPGLHLLEPCLILPDPGGPGRRARLQTELRDWIAVIGPTVDIVHGARSLRWARRALELAVQGHLDTAKPISTDDHVLRMVLLHGREMMDHLVTVLLGPLATFRDAQRPRLAETLLMCLQSGFNASDVAVRLHLHPQTVRYRIRQLEEAFGLSIHDPERNLEYQAALTYWFTTPSSQTPPDQA